MRGLEALGLTNTATADAINAASEALSAAIDLGQDAPEGSEALAEVFSELDDEFWDRVEHVSDEMLALLKSGASEFKNFP